MTTTYTQRAKLFDAQARQESDPVKANELFRKAKLCSDLAKDPVIIDQGKPCGYCGSTEGYSNDEGQGDGWYRCLNCQGN